MKKISSMILAIAVALSVGVPVWGSYIIPDLSITTGKIAANAVTSAKIANGAVGPAQLVARSGFTLTISAATATSGWQYTNNSQTFTLITSISAATTAYFAGTGAPAASGTLTCVAASGCGGNLTFSAFSAGAPTALAGGIAISPNSGNVQNGSTVNSWIDVTNLSITITTTGRPVYLMLVSGVNTTSPTAGIGENGNGQIGYFAFNRGGSVLVDHQITVGTGPSYVPCSALQHVDVVSAGTYTYKVQMQTSVVSNVQVVNCQLVAFEL